MTATTATTAPYSSCLFYFSLPPEKLPQFVNSSFSARGCRWPDVVSRRCRIETWSQTQPSSRTSTPRTGRTQPSIRAKQRQQSRHTLCIMLPFFQTEVVKTHVEIAGVMFCIMVVITQTSIPRHTLLILLYLTMYNGMTYEQRWRARCTTVKQRLTTHSFIHSIL